MWAALIIIAVIVLLGLFLVGIYNGMVRARNRVDEAWSGIDVQLKRRHDLIPNLVETVKGYATHEREVFEAVTQARAAAMGAQTPAQSRSRRGRADRSARPAVRRRRGLPAAARDRELPAVAGRADEHRGSDLGRAAHLQRQRAGLQHEDPDVPRQPCSPACSASRSASSSRSTRRATATCRTCPSAHLPQHRRPSTRRRRTPASVAAVVPAPASRGGLPRRRARPGARPARRDALRAARCATALRSRDCRS